MARSRANHSQILEACKVAVGELYADKSVSPRETKDSLEEIKQEIDGYLESLAESEDEHEEAE